MHLYKLVFIGLLIAGLNAPFISYAQSRDCNSISVSAEVVSSNGGEGKPSIIVKLNSPSDVLVVSLIMPKGGYILDSKTLEFEGLQKGNYVVVVNGRSEKDNYCITHKEILID